jgi:hypothetical protein
VAPPSPQNPRLSAARGLGHRAHRWLGVAMTEHKAVAATPVLDAGRIVGHVIEKRCGQVEAVPANGNSLGHFNDQRAALNALLAVSVRKAD